MSRIPTTTEVRGYTITLDSQPSRTIYRVTGPEWYEEGEGTSRKQAFNFAINAAMSRLAVIRNSAARTSMNLEALRRC